MQAKSKPASCDACVLVARVLICTDKIVQNSSSAAGIMLDVWSMV